MVREILDLVILIFKILKCLKSFYTNKLSIIDFIDVEIPPWIDQINSCTITTLTLSQDGVEEETTSR